MCPASGLGMVPGTGYPPNWIASFCSVQNFDCCFDPVEVNRFLGSDVPCFHYLSDGLKLGSNLSNHLGPSWTD